MLIYRLTIIAIAPVVALGLLWRLVRGRESRAGLRQRFGGGARADIADVRGPVLWVHGASLGELTAARPVIDHILGQNSKLQVVVTMNTMAALAMAQNWNHTRIHARLAPLDSRLVLARFLNHWSPIAAITLENEIWPARILACAERGIPVAVVGARLSARSAAMWARLPRLAAPVMAAISVLAPLDAVNAARFAALGLAKEKTGAEINPKAMVQLSPPNPAVLRQLQAIFSHKNTICAASTHRGEDQIILAAFQAAQQQHPGLRLILVPRHPDRAPEVAGLITAAGLTCARRSAGEKPDVNTPVYLADTVGEMALWHSLSVLSIIGGSFVQKGGHTPFEPAQFDSVIVHGPDTANHAAAYGALGHARAAFCAETSNDLTTIIVRLISSTETASIAARARQALAPLGPQNSSLQDMLDRLNALTGGNLAPALLDQQKINSV